MRFSIRRLLRFGLLLVVTPAASATTWYVNGVSGSNSNNCLSVTTSCRTIGHAISLSSSGDSIIVAAATYTENLNIAINLRIIGAGASTTIIDGGGVGTVVTIGSGARVTLAKLTFQNGRTMGGGGGIYNRGNVTITHSTITGNVAGLQCITLRCFGHGGGILNAGGTTTVLDSTISGNSAGGTCGYILSCYGDGGGIHNVAGKLTVSRSTIDGNLAFAVATGIGGHGSAGGGISNSGAVMINNSTIQGNNAVAGGGLINAAGATMTISSGTISGNHSDVGGGIYDLGTIVLQNSIVASNTGGNCYGSTTSNGYNLSSDVSCNFTSTGDLNNTDPMLGPLQKNGGPTQTMALPSASPAVDAGNPSGCSDGLGHLLKTDQRGKPRPDKEDTGGCDIGAYESQSD